MRCYQNRELRWIPYGFGLIIIALLFMELYQISFHENRYLISITLLLGLFLILTRTLNGIYMQLEILTETLDKIDTPQGHILPYHKGEGTLPNLQNELAKLQKRITYHLELSEKDGKRVNDFMENMAHQLKTTVTALCIRLELAIEWEKLDKQKKTLEQCLFHADRLTNDLDRILESSSLEAGKVNMNLSFCSIHQILQTVVEQMQSLADKKEETLHLTCTGTSHMHCDNYWIYQAFENIIKNGIEHNVPKGQIIILEQDIGNKKQITIKDSGDGIPKIEIPHLFTRFFSGKRKGTGYGLGLNMAKNIIEGHHGTLTAGNHPEEGALFTITLPLLEGSLPYEDTKGLLVDPYLDPMIQSYQEN